ncbi:MAG: Gfo/Idh/MocA family oxidoreductase [Treponema sp.]|nr:Gfo/Idh/MocA family oxidoreductase [Treponema sp.]
MAVNSQYTAALVGCGRIGYSLGLDAKREQPASHTMALLDNRRIRLVAGCDSDIGKLSVWHKAVPGAKSYQRSEDMYREVHPDIITVAVPEEFHKSEALAAIAARPKLVILEKPVALNSREAQDIKNASVEAGVPVMINHERRFAEDYKKAKACMAGIGCLQSIYAFLSSSLCLYDRKGESTGAFSLFHDGTHLVDAVMYFLGDPPSLGQSLLTGIYKDEKGSIRQLSAHWATDKCPDITVTMSGRARYFGFEIQLNGTEGRICIGNSYLKIYQRKDSPLYTGFFSLVSDKEAGKIEKTRYFSNMVQNAVDFLDGKAPLLSPIDTGIKDLLILEDIKSSLYR